MVFSSNIQIVRNPVEENFNSYISWTSGFEPLHIVKFKGDQLLAVRRRSQRTRGLA